MLTPNLHITFSVRKIRTNTNETEFETESEETEK